MRSHPRRLTWRDALRAALVSGSAASATSTAMLALSGKLEAGDAAAPTNSTSHWLWGERALRTDGADVRHTAVGYAIHHAASVFWATLYEKWFGGRPRPARRVWQEAAAVSALACLVDYTLTPPRLRPGFEKRLSPPSLLAVYAAFAAGLAASTLARDLPPHRPRVSTGAARSPDRPAAGPSDAHGWPASR